MITVDAKGLQCPEPVMKTLAAIKENPNEIIQTIVSNAISRDNVASMAKKRGKDVKIEEVENDFILTLT